MEIEELQQKYPKIYQAVFDKGHAKGVKTGEQNAGEAVREQGRIEGRKDGIAEGEKAERERIQAVEACLIPGHENLIASLKFDGETTGGQAALKVLQAEKTLRTDVATQIRDDREEPLDHAATPEVETPKDKKKQSKDPKTQWENDTELQEEFGSFDTWQAYEKAVAKGQVKILGKGGK